MSKTLKEVFPDYYANGGIFAKMATEYYVPYITTPLEWNVMYVGQRSGNKVISPLLEDFIDSDGILTDAKLDSLARTFLAMFGNNLSEIWNAINLDYNILDNYNATETETVSRVIDNTGTTTNAKGTATTVSKNLSTNGSDTTEYGKVDTNVNSMVKNTTVATDETTTYGKKDNITDSLQHGTTVATDESTTYGKKETIVDAKTDTKSFMAFNTTQFYDSEKNTIADNLTNTLSGTDTNSRDEVTTGTDTHTIADTLSGSDTISRDEVTTGTDTNTITDTLSGSDVVTNTQTIVATDIETNSGSDVVTDNTKTTETNTRNWERVGNIGVNTNQDAIIEELQLRANNLMCNFVFEKMDRLLTSPIFL